MVDHSCAIGCQNSRKKNKEGVSKKNFKFYRIPKAKKNKKQRELWIKNIKRADWPERKINNARICSDHFISGR